jgi:hypothetical protein
MWLVPNGGCRVLLFLAIYGEFCLKCVWVGCNVFIWAKTSSQFEAQFKFGLVKNCSCLRHHLPRQCHAPAITAPRVCHVSATRCHISTMSVPRVCHVVVTSYATWLPRHQLTCHQSPRQHHVSSQLISISDVASQSMTITFVTDFGLQAGFNGLYTNLWRLENVMDHAYLWRKFKDVTRRDPWRSIHDVLKFRHRCHFMTKFWWSVTKIDRHRPRDFL